MTKKLIVLNVILLIFCATSNAQWTQTTLDSGFVYTISSNSGKTFAGTWYNNGYLSTDYGISWSHINPQTSILNDVINSSTIVNNMYFVGGNYKGVFTSTDGISWTIHVPDPAFVGSKKVNAMSNNGTKVFAGTNKGVYVTSDNGNTWYQPTTGFLYSSNVLSLASSASRTFAGTLTFGFFMTVTNGTSWTQPSSRFQYSYIDALAYDGTYLYAGVRDSGIFVSTNNGVLWTAVNTGLTDLHINSIIIDGNAIFAGTNNGVFLSTDNGAHWIAKNVGLTNLKVRTLSAYNLYVLAGTDDGIFSMLRCSNVANAGVITGNSSVCKGQNSVSYSVPVIAQALTYVWTLPTGASGSSSTNNISVNYGTSAVSGNITVKGQNNCFDGAISTLAISVNNVPTTPIITINSNVLQSNLPTGNQWYNQNGLIGGATSQNYTPLINGDYYVIVTTNGCSSSPSNSLHVTITGIEQNVLSNSIKFYPNPVTNELIIQNDENNFNIGFEIFNTLGQIVFKGNLEEKTVVQTTNFTDGVYLIKLDNGKTFEFKKIIKE